MTNWKDKLNTPPISINAMLSTYEKMIKELHANNADLREKNSTLMKVVNEAHAGLMAIEDLPEAEVTTPAKHVAKKTVAAMAHWLERGEAQDVAQAPAPTSEVEKSV